MLWKPPAQLFHDLEAVGLGAFGVVRSQIDVHESPAVLVADFAAEAVISILIFFCRHPARGLNSRDRGFSFRLAPGGGSGVIHTPLWGRGGARSALRLG